MVISEVAAELVLTSSNAPNFGPEVSLYVSDSMKEIYRNSALNFQPLDSLQVKLLSGLDIDALNKVLRSILHMVASLSQWMAECNINLIILPEHVAILSVHLVLRQQTAICPAIAHIFISRWLLCSAT